MEIWKDITGYEGFYQVSNYGNVRSLKKWCGNKHIKKWIDDIRVLKPLKNNKGYFEIHLKKNCKRKKYFIHRLVATAFLDKPIGKEVINHKDYNPLNNNVENLEWVTQKENVNYSICNMKKRKTITHSNTNEKYISYRENKKIYRLTIDKKEYHFKTLQEAITKRDEILKAVMK